VNNFCDQLLPTDRPHFSDETGLINRDTSYIKLPSDSWQWESGWQIVDTFENQLLAQDVKHALIKGCHELIIS